MEASGQGSSVEVPKNSVSFEVCLLELFEVTLNVLKKPFLGT